MAIERTAEILDTATGQFTLTFKGAVFVGRAECARALVDLRRIDRGPAARFVVDWHDENNDILETFGIDERGFEALTGEAPKTPDEYANQDAAHWETLLQGRLGGALPAKAPA